MMMKNLTFNMQHALFVICFVVKSGKERKIEKVYKNLVDI